MQIFLNTGNKPKNILDLVNVINSQGVGLVCSNQEVEIALKEVAVSLTTTLGDITITEYKLTDNHYQSTKKARESSDDNLRKVFDYSIPESFKSDPDSTDIFRFALGVLFHSLAVQYAYNISNGKVQNDFEEIAYNATAVLEKTKARFPSKDCSWLNGAITQFLQSRDPSFDEVKWTLCQNYFVSILLGMDSGIAALAESIFSKGTFYIDTNVIIAALEPSDPLHIAVHAIRNASERLGSHLRVCNISLEEMESWLAYQQILISERLQDQIPKDLIPRVEWLVYKIYQNRRVRDSNYEFKDDLLSSFADYRTTLRENYDIELEDDVWFDHASGQESIKSFALSLINRSHIFDPRPKGMKRAAA